MKDKVSLTLYLDKDISKALQRRALELSLKSETKVTRSELVEKALSKLLGVKPCISPKRKGSTKE